jgi:prepilin-type N-terminal cleavage/methylation domain-containing protein
MKLARNRERGFTLLETMIAMVVLGVSMLGILAMVGVATSVNAGQGDRAPRTTELAEAKMEQLLSLSYSNSQTDTTVWPVASSGGSGLAAGGGVTAGSPVASYVDYLDANGNYGTSSSPITAANAYYIRQWQIVQDASGQFKTITVFARCVTAAGVGAVPSTTISSIKANL